MRKVQVTVYRPTEGKYTRQEGREPTANATIWPCHSRQDCHSRQECHRKLHLLNLIVQVIKVRVLQGHFARDSLGRIID